MTNQRLDEYDALRPAIRQPRIVVAGTHSGVGKTTVAVGLMAALRRRGLRVQAFKTGPDFIDPTFHDAATRRRGYNLDGWMLSREANLEIYARAAEDADVAVIEGAMGLFDGKSGGSLAGSTAEIAMWLDAAVLLVLDGSAMAGSAAALVHGFDTLISELPVAAVLANKLAGYKHYEYLRDAIAARCRPEPVGYLARDTSFALPERHLGLHLAQESLTAERLDVLADAIESSVDLDRLLEVSERQLLAARCPVHRKLPPRLRIGIARDQAFCFYYQDNLNLLRDLGAELIEFSPMADSELPAGLHGIYLGGGYPEIYAAALSSNQSMMCAISRFAGSDRPVYGECGGFMYLTEAIVDAEGHEWSMAGIFPTKARMQKRLAKLGYIEISTNSEARWLPAAITARGHEFRYSTIDPMPDVVQRVYQSPAEAYQVGSTVGSYIHLHFLSCPAFAAGFTHGCERARNSNEL